MKSIDPRTHLLLILICGITVFICRTNPQFYLLFALSAIYLVLCGRWQRALKCTLVFALLQAILLFASAERIGSFGVVIFTICRMMPPALMGMALLTRPHSVILCAGERMRIPKPVMLMICILLRFFPVILGEMRIIAGGIRARSILPHWYDIIRHPAISYECFVLPLLIRALKISNELACAAEVRGVESTACRTTVHPIGFHSGDVLAAGLYVLCNTAILIWGGAL